MFFFFLFLPFFPSLLLPHTAPFSTRTHVSPGRVRHSIFQIRITGQPYTRVRNPFSSINVLAYDNSLAHTHTHTTTRFTSIAKKLKILYVAGPIFSFLSVFNYSSLVTVTIERRLQDYDAVFSLYKR